MSVRIESNVETGVHHEGYQLVGSSFLESDHVSV